MLVLILRIVLNDLSDAAVDTGIVSKVSNILPMVE
jgi:hypothetical protein